MSDPQDERAWMVRTQIERRGVRDPRVLQAMRSVPREHFVDPAYREQAYADCALPIAHGQTISQPYVVAFMVEALALGPADKVLEIGTGSGYAAAVLSRIAAEVVSVERVPELASAARARLERLAFERVRVVVGDGSLGWPPDAPYDAILVSAGAPDVPPPYAEQVRPGGRVVIPLGPSPSTQRLVRLTRTASGGWDRQVLSGVRFVPLVGRHGWPSDAL